MSEDRVYKGGVVPAVSTSGAYTLPDALAGGFAMWVANTNGAATASIYIPAAINAFAQFIGGVTSTTIQTSHIANFQNIGGSYIVVHDYSYSTQ